MPEVEIDQTPRKRGRPTAHERTQRRDDILDAAVRLFVRDGFERVTLDDIVVEAHVTKRTIYSYIGDRNEIFLAAIARLRERTLLVSASEEGVASVAESIVMTLQSDDAIGLHRLMIAEAHRIPELARQFYEEGPRSYIAVLGRTLPDRDPAVAEHLFALLLGEPHRQRLLGLRAAPDRAEAAAQASAALSALGLSAERLGSMA
ncbi:MULTISPECIES: TetR/AcrR family transcriptional regulator [unclassified Microbacterium]|uniref:TetR/AcrR family transcriptional regulator n=1 Tax=unclassified Microbacterium TaxID=2609290 RepID=UPI003015FC04